MQVLHLLRFSFLCDGHSNLLFKDSDDCLFLELCIRDEQFGGIAWAVQVYQQILRSGQYGIDISSLWCLC